MFVFIVHLHSVIALCVSLFMQLLDDPSSISLSVLLTVIIQHGSQLWSFIDVVLRSVNYWAVFSMLYMLLASLHIQIGNQGDREAPQIVALNIFSTNSSHYVLNSLLKKAILFIKPVITSRRQGKRRKGH